MNFENRIISASAGTGKTYRLSLEYLSLILKYYKEHPEFSLDSVLVLTFTRKATAEIRERIYEHLKTLINGEDDSLLKSIRKHFPGQSQSPELSPKEENKLRSALLEIQADQRMLQVMTIDSYIGSIFRNIVRPLRSIDRYELENDAEKKRLPYLMNHLMNPQFRDRVDRLLSRNLQRSLDDYGAFFQSLIQNRWVYYLTEKIGSPDPAVRPEAQHDFAAEFSRLAQIIFEICQSKNKANYAQYFKKGFTDLMPEEFTDPAHLLLMTTRLLERSPDAMALLKVLNDSPVFNGHRIRGAEEKGELIQQQNIVLQALGERLYLDYFLPEQEEIRALWKIVLDEYDKLIYRYKNMSYQDITWLTFEALFSPDPPLFNLEDASDATEFYAFLSHRSRFILIDEFQDTSLLQFKILLPIMEELSAGYGSKEIGGVVVVGDEKQSIFGWRGGERDLLLNLREIIPSLGEIEIERLNQSWRAGQDMMDFINHIFTDSALHGYLKDRDMDWEYPQVESALGDLKSSIEFKCRGYSNQKGEKPGIYHDFVEHMILPAIKDQETESIAILCRTNSQLAELQLILEEHQKNPVFQPSAPITDHHLIAPLMHWLRYVSYGDWLDLLAFLRSDYLLMPSPMLKRLVDNISAYEEGKKPGREEQPFDPDDIPGLQSFFELAAAQSSSAPYPALLEILDQCPIDPDSTPERDYLNLQSFLKICRDWELNSAEADLSIPDFLDYVQDNISQEDFTQVSVENTAGIQLLSIHKSKGLQFDRVFIFYDMGGGGGPSEGLYWALQYTDKTYRQLAAYALTYHYEKVLPHSPLAGLWAAKEKAALLEELNTLYVAFTRARQDLHLFFAYGSSRPWSEYFADKADDGSAKLPQILADACSRYFLDTQADIHGIKRITKGREDEDARPTEAALEDYELAAPLSISRPSRLNWDEIQSPERPEKISYKEVYLDKRQALWGDIAHYYLSLIKRDLPDEHANARRQSISRYGSLLPLDRLNSLFDRLQEITSENSYLFSEDYDRIYNEFEVKSYRLDRLMLDSLAKRALIIDYKTGGVHEKDQLDIYAQALGTLPALQGYRIETQYLMLEI